MGIFVFVRVSKKLQLVRNDSSFMSNSHKTHLLPLSNHASTSFLYFHFRQKKLVIWNGKSFIWKYLIIINDQSYIMRKQYPLYCSVVGKKLPNSNLDIYLYCHSKECSTMIVVLCLVLRTHLSSGVSVACIRRHKRHFIPNAENAFAFV